MPRKPRLPEVPPELLAEFGEVEHTFGPNRRFRVATTLAGVLLLGLAAAFLVFGLVTRDGPQDVRATSGLLLLLAGGLFVIGGVAAYLPLTIPRNWVLVGSHGLARQWNGDWSALAWADVARFEDLSLTTGLVAVRQCRLVLADGTAWGFVENGIADYGRLARVLREKVDAQAQDSNRA